MPLPIEDYAVIGDTGSVALVGLDGSIDWLCAPRFDSPAVFAALLGDPSHGRWQLAPAETPTKVTRRYVDDTLVLETEFTTSSGTVVVRDGMPIRDGGPSIARVVEGRAGTVAMQMELVVRFDYGSIVPWVRRVTPRPSERGGSLFGGTAIGGGDGLVLRAGVEPEGHDLTTVASFDVREGERVPFTLSWFASYAATPEAFDAIAALDECESWWREWSAGCTYRGRWRDEVLRSLITLKALTYAPTGGIVAAPTTSLPEWLGGVRNWDYRFTWLRDATFTLNALLDNGFADEATRWSEWLRRAIAGSPDKLQIMYAVDGGRRLTELELDWLPGYENSSPVRIGNEASGQFQLDVYGEVLDMLFHSLECLGHHLGRDSWDLARFLVEHVAKVWADPDDGIWEVRGPRRHFVHSKVMAWVAVDRWVKLCEMARPEEDLDHWRSLRDTMHRQICDQGYNADVGSFTQYYGSTELDASLLMLMLVGFLPPDDPRMVATVEAVQRELVVDGFVKRYRTDVAPVGATVDGLPPGEGAFLLTTFWLVDNLVLLGRVDEATEIFERLLALRNDVGLLSEEYDVAAGRMLGNFPQAFSHIGVVLSAHNLSRGTGGPAGHRSGLTPS